MDNYSVLSFRVLRALTFQVDKQMIKCWGTAEIVKEGKMVSDRKADGDRRVGAFDY